MAVEMFFTDADHQMSSLITIRLHKATRRYLIRLTGGSNYMDPSIGATCVEVLSNALSGFNGVVLFGGTRTIRIDDPSVILPTISEVPSNIKTADGLMFFGVIPRTSVMKYDQNVGLILETDFGSGLMTIVHPDQDVCLQVQRNVDDFAPWDAEWKECSRVVEAFTRDGNWNSLLIVYNGGETTLREARHWASRNWPILLIRGSGRAADQLIHELAGHPSTLVAENDADSVREVLTNLKAIKGEL